MADPIPPADDLDAELRRASETIRMLKRSPLGETAAAARARSCQLVEAQKRLKAASRQVADGTVAKSVANGGAPHASAANGVRQFVRAVAREIAALQKRIAELEATALRGGDVWRMGQSYKQNQVTTHDGALWIAKRANSDVRPGQSDDWRLMHKTKGKW